MWRAAAVLALLVASQLPRTQGWPFTLAPEDAGSTTAGIIRARLTALWCGSSSIPASLWGDRLGMQGVRRGTVLA